MVCSYHIGALLSPGEGERGIARPLAVQSDISIYVYSNWPGLHYQYWADWKADIILFKKKQGVSQSYRFFPDRMGPLRLGLPDSTNSGWLCVKIKAGSFHGLICRRIKDHMVRQNKVHLNEIHLIFSLILLVAICFLLFFFWLCILLFNSTIFKNSCFQHVCLSHLLVFLLSTS